MKLFELTSDIKIREMSGPDFYQLVAKDDSIKKRIKYLSSWHDQDREYNFVAFSGDKIVAALGIWPREFEKGVVAIPFVSVDPSFKGQGIARELIDHLFQYAKKHSLKIRGSSYTDEGEATIKSSFERFSKQYDVPFKDGSDHYKFDQ